MVAAAKADLPPWLQKLLGRWKGDSYKVYRPENLELIGNYTRKLFIAAVNGKGSCKLPAPQLITHATPDPYRYASRAKST